MSTLKSSVLTEQVRIDTNGNVGIGTVSPFFGLALPYDKTFAFQYGTNVASRNWGIAVDQTVYGDFQIITSSAKTDGLLDTPRLVINNLGNVGIGTTTPQAKLTVEETVTTVNPILILGGSLNAVNAGHSLDFRHTSNAASYARVAGVTNSTGETGELSLWTSTGLNTAATEKLRITGAGNVGIGTTTPQPYLPSPRQETRDQLLVQLMEEALLNGCLKILQMLLILGLQVGITVAHSGLNNRPELHLVPAQPIKGL